MSRRAQKLRVRRRGRRGWRRGGTDEKYLGLLRKVRERRRVQRVRVLRRELV